MSFIAAGLAIAGSAVSYFGARKAAKKAEAAENKASKELDAMKRAYSNLDTSNPFADMENRFEGMENQYAGLENTMEDLTINQKQFDLERDMFQQSQANIMDSMRGAAGGSGIAAMAQSLAQQGQLQAQRAAATVGQQEAANEMAAAQQAGQLQQLEAAGAERMDMQERQGQAAVDQLIAKGEQASQQMEIQKQGTLLGISQQEAAASREAAAKSAEQKTSTLGKVIGAVGSLFSDRRLKNNIKKIGKSPSGINVYTFEYINKDLGDGVYQGVMSDDVPLAVVTRHANGYDTVDYSKIDVEFKNIN